MSHRPDTASFHVPMVQPGDPPGPQVHAPKQQCQLQASHPDTPVSRAGKGTLVEAKSIVPGAKPFYFSGIQPQAGEECAKVQRRWNGLS